MAKKIEFDDNGLALSTRGFSRYYGVAYKPDSGRYYVAVDIQRIDGEIRTTNYRPYKYTMDERDVAYIATTMISAGRQLPDGTEFRSLTDPNNTKYRIEGRFIRAFNTHTGMPLIDSDIRHRGGKDWGRREGMERKAGVKKAPNIEFVPQGTKSAKSEDTWTTNPTTTEGAKENVDMLYMNLESQLSEDELVIVKAFVEDQVSIADKVNPAVKAWLKSIL